MSGEKWTEVEVAIRIVPTLLRWPQHGTSVAWTAAHDCVNACRQLVRSVDISCVEAEQNPQMSANDVARCRAEVCEQSLRKLVTFRPLELAEEALKEEINALERLSILNPRQVEMHGKLKQAVRDIREGVAATGRALQERCRVREHVSVF